MEPPEWPTEPPTAPVPPTPPPPAWNVVPPPAPWGAPPPPNPWGVAALAVLLGGALALTIGGLTALAVFMAGSSECRDSGELFCGLGWLLIGFLFGLAAAGVAYVVSGVLFINSRMPAGSRAVPIVTFLLTPIGLMMVLGILGNLAESLGSI